MFKHITVKKKLSVFVVALFIVSLATGTYFSYDQGYAHGYIQGMAEAGGTPTIDGTVGIYDMPWVNGTAANFEEFYLNGENKTDLLAYPELGESYVIFKEGSNYYAKNGVSGKIDYFGSNFASILNSTLTQGGSIFITSGEYIATQNINPKNGDFQLIGEGRGKTILKLGCNGNLLQLSTINNITIRDISFDGNKETYDSDLWSGLLLQKVDNILVDNCDFYDFAGKGTFARGVTDSTFFSNHYYSNGQDGLYFEEIIGVQTSRTNAISCFSYLNGRKGFNVGDVKNLNFISCSAFNNTEDGWNIEGSANGSYFLSHVRLELCSSYSNGNNGFRIQMQTDNVQLIGCDSYNNSGAGIYLRGNDDYLMVNTKIIGGNFYENRGSGVSVSYGQKFTQLCNLNVFNNDQANSNHDGIEFGYMTNNTYLMINNVFAYDDQETATQDRGIDFGTSDLSLYHIIATNIMGEGNTNGLFRGTLTATHFIQGRDI